MSITTASILQQVNKRLSIIEANMATKDDLTNGLGKLERSLKRRMGQHKNQIMASVSQLAMTTPTRKEFNALKIRFDQSYPAN